MMAGPGIVDTRLLAWMPLDARRVLEIGCGDGVLAAAYRERNPSVHYTGVEPEVSAAEIAAGRVDRLLRSEMSGLDDAEVMDGAPFDAIVVKDLPRCGVGPVPLLRRLCAMLTHHGHLIVGFTNAGHWSSLAHLLHGRWPGGDGAAADDTGPHLFTLPSFVALLDAAGLAMVRARPLNRAADPASAAGWLSGLADVAAGMGIDRDAFLGRAQAARYLVVAARTGAVRPLRLRLSVAALAPRLMEVRARLPADHLQSVPDITVHYAEKDVVLPRAAGPEPKIVVIQRAGPRRQEAWTELLATAIRRGWLVVSEWDDHPDLTARVLGWGPDRDRWQVIGQVHAVQTSTEALAKAFRAHNPEVAVFPNAAFALPPFPAPRPGPPTVFYGALNRGAHPVEIARALAPAVAACPGMRFEVVHDRAFFDALPTDAKRFHETLAYDAYLELLGGCDIALMPLEGRPEELTKSDLKYVEAAAGGVAVIASPAVYAATIRTGRTGLIADRPDAWAAALSRLAGDPGERRRIARAAWEDVRDDRMFTQQIPERLAWYESLWARREELQRGLLARVPGLAEKLA